MPTDRLGNLWGYNPLNNQYYSETGKIYSVDQLTAEERKKVGISEVSSYNNGFENQQNLISNLNDFNKQIDSLETTTPVQISPDVINAWNTFKNMSTMELSTLSPFAVIFLVVNPAILDGLNQINSSALSEIKWYKANIRGYGKKIVFPIAATKNIFETINFSGGLGLTNFSIGSEYLQMISGNFSFDILSLDEFDNNFVASAFLSPVNVLLTVHGWSGPNIWVDLPFDLKNGEEWETEVGSINPGLWSINLVNLTNRTFTPNESSFSCECTFKQHTTTNVGSAEDNSEDKNESFKVASDQFKNFTTGSSQKINENLIDKSTLLSKLRNVYKDSNFDYINKKLNDSWFVSQDEFIKKYSLKRKNEDGDDDYVYDRIFYPLGMVIESIIAAHYSKNSTEPLMRVLYEETYNSTTEEDLNLPPYRFSANDGNNKETWSLPIKSAFDIPIPREKVQAILQKPDNQWREAIFQLISSVKPEYRLLQKGINKTINNTYFDCTLEFTEQKIDKEIAKSLEIDEEKDLIFEYRAKNSLIGNVTLETSSINLENAAALGLQNILGERSTVFLDNDSSGNKEVSISTTKQPTNDEKYDYVENDVQDNDIQNAELITNLYTNDSANRGFLLRLFSQILTIETHGIAGISTAQVCWVRGLTKGLNGKYMILSITENVVPDGYTLSLKLANLNFAQDSIGLQNLQNNSNENNDNIDNTSTTTTTNTVNETKKVGKLTDNVKTGFGVNDKFTSF